MERFRKFIDAKVNEENVKNAVQLKSYGIVCTYLPDPVEEFDEFEFRTGFNGQENMVITFAVEMGKIKRLMFGEADANNPDVVRSLGEGQLKSFLTEKGDYLTSFFEFITG